MPGILYEEALRRGEVPDQVVHRHALHLVALEDEDHEAFQDLDVILTEWRGLARNLLINAGCNHRSVVLDVILEEHS